MNVIVRLKGILGDKEIENKRKCQLLNKKENILNYYQKRSSVQGAKH